MSEAKRQENPPVRRFSWGRLLLVLWLAFVISGHSGPLGGITTWVGGILLAAILVLWMLDVAWRMLNPPRR